MEIRKWLIIFVLTAVAGKFFATALTKLHLLPEDTFAHIEKTAVQEVKKLFFKDTAEISPLIPKTPVMPIKKLVPPTAPKPLLFGLTPEKKTEKVKEEEKARRKKRKKKLEQAADKNKKATLTVQKLGDEKGKKKDLIQDSGFATYSTFTENKKETTDSLQQKEKVDLAKWLTLLQQQPTPQNLKTFVALYKSHKISAVEYYGILSQLQKSTQQEVRRLAILGSSIEPHNLAFQILVHEKYTETVIALQELALQRLVAYRDPKFLSFLMEPMTRGDLYSKIESSDLVGQIARSYQSSPQLVLTAEARGMFNRYISVLTRLSLDSSELLRNMASQSLLAVKQVLGIAA